MYIKVHIIMLPRNSCKAPWRPARRRRRRGCCHYLGRSSGARHHPVSSSVDLASPPPWISLGDGGKGRQMQVKAAPGWGGRRCSSTANRWWKWLDTRCRSGAPEHLAPAASTPTARWPVRSVAGSCCVHAAADRGGRPSQCRVKAGATPFATALRATLLCLCCAATRAVGRRSVQPSPSRTRRCSLWPTRPRRP
jgi:hypothetical protein